MKRNKIDPDKVTFGTYYQAFQVSKKPLATSVAANAGGGPFNPSDGGGGKSNEVAGLRDKESYLKYSAEDFHQKLQEFAFNQQKEEEKLLLKHQNQKKQHMNKQTKR